MDLSTTSSPLNSKHETMKRKRVSTNKNSPKITKSLKTDKTQAHRSVSSDDDLEAESFIPAILSLVSFGIGLHLVCFFCPFPIVTTFIGIVISYIIWEWNYLHGYKLSRIERAAYDVHSDCTINYPNYPAAPGG
ncbi:hypothetical protein DdX_07993 [Ditylenchus destructor]|uniref:Uncharacterized protein n=1 Tax=Ditylenchus destructor TaxID=166010 RepID=A0AAD4N5L3_9BILA|nr:hypothetical protein DdX_07993 [Ditylenchus destructor]